MSFQHSETTKNSFVSLPYDNDNASSILPSIYTSQKKQMTSSEWADKAANWVKAKQSNEAMWNAFGIPPAPKVSSSMESLNMSTTFPTTISSVTSLNSNIENTELCSNSQMVGDMFVPNVSSNGIEQGNIISKYNNVSNDKIENRRKLVPNWIKSVQSSQSIKNKSSCSLSIHSNNNNLLSNKKNNIPRISQMKIDMIAKEISSNILLLTASSLISKICKYAIEQLNHKDNKKYHRVETSSDIMSGHATPNSNSEHGSSKNSRNISKRHSSKHSKRRRYSYSSRSNDYNDRKLHRHKYSSHRHSRHRRRKRSKYSSDSSNSSSSDYSR